MLLGRYKKGVKRSSGTFLLHFYIMHKIERELRDIHSRCKIIRTYNGNSTCCKSMGY